jgi:hypothetical protein
MPFRLGAGDAEGSRTHYLAGPGTHCGNWQGLLLAKNKVGRTKKKVLYPMGSFGWSLASGSTSQLLRGAAF